jgi:hypothetical protein
MACSFLTTRPHTLIIQRIRSSATSLVYLIGLECYTLQMRELSQCNQQVRMFETAPVGQRGKQPRGTAQNDDHTTESEIYNERLMRRSDLQGGSVCRCNVRAINAILKKKKTHICHHALSVGTIAAFLALLLLLALIFFAAMLALARA